MAAGSRTHGTCTGGQPPSGVDGSVEHNGWYNLPYPLNAREDRGHALQHCVHLAPFTTCTLASTLSTLPSPLNAQEDRGRALQRWANHVRDGEGSIWRCAGLLTAAGLPGEAARALLDAGLPDAAAAYVEACRGVGLLPFGMGGGGSGGRGGGGGGFLDDDMLSLDSPSSSLQAEGSGGGEGRADAFGGRSSAAAESVIGGGGAAAAVVAVMRQYEQYVVDLLVSGRE